MTLTLSPKGEALLNSLKSQLEQNQKQCQDRNARIDNCEVEPTDCFRSIHANQVINGVIRAKIAIMENGGVWEFPALADLEGNIVDAKLCHGKFGSFWKLANGSNISNTTTEKTLAKKGFQVVGVNKPAWATQDGYNTVYFPINENKATQE